METALLMNRRWQTQRMRTYGLKFDVNCSIGLHHKDMGMRVTEALNGAT